LSILINHFKLTAQLLAATHLENPQKPDFKN